MSTTNNKLSNPNLSESEEEAIIGTFVRRYENERLRKRWSYKLSTDHQVFRPTTGPPRTSIRKIILPIISIAASLLLFLAFLPGFLKTDGEALMANYLTETTIENSRSAPTNELEQARTQLIANFASGNFAAAVTAGEGLLMVPGATDEDRYSLGLAYLHNNNLEQAITSFCDLLDRPTDFRTEAHFHLGLSHLRKGNITSGLDQLKQISEADGQKIHAKAQKILGAKWD
jgi:tetratricopeptide (TPR) repeat protein